PARRVGFRVPVAITRAAWADCVQRIGAAAMQETEEDRLHDLLRELNERAVRASEIDPEGVALMRFYRMPPIGDGPEAQAVTIQLCSTMDETDMPVITVSLASEH